MNVCLSSIAFINQDPFCLVYAYHSSFSLAGARASFIWAAITVWGLLHLHPEGKSSFGSSPHRSVLHGHLHSLADGVCSWHPLFRSEDQTPPLSCAITDFPPSPFQYVTGEFALLRKTLSLICVQPADCSNAGAAILEIGSRLCHPAVPNCITERQCIYGRVSLQAPWGCQNQPTLEACSSPCGYAHNLHDDIASGSIGAGGKPSMFVPVMQPTLACR